MKKPALIFLIAAIVCGALSLGTAKAADTLEPTETPEPEPVVRSFHQEGVELSIPEEIYALGFCEAEAGMTQDNNSEVSISLYSPALRTLIDDIIAAIYDETSTDEEIMEIQSKALQLYKQLLTIRIYDEEKYETALAEGQTLTDLAGVDNATELGRQEGYVYIIFEPENDLTDADSETAESYEKLLEYIPAIRESATLIPIQQEGAIGNTVPLFSAEDLTGNIISNEIFTGKKVTMINIWATFCGPCIDEMPDLAELSRTLPDEAQIIGLIVDIEGDTNLQLAKDIVAQANSEYTHIIAESVLMDYTRDIAGVPTSIFVDEYGNQIGDLVLGTRTAEEYRAIIEELLK